MNKTKLKKLLLKLESSEEVFSGFKDFDAIVFDLKEKLKESIYVTTIDDVNHTLDKFKKQINIEPLVKETDELKKAFVSAMDNLCNELEIKISELTEMNSEVNNNSKEKSDSLQKDILNTESQIKELIKDKNRELEELKKEIKNIDGQIEIAKDSFKDDLDSHKEKMFQSLIVTKSEILSRIVTNEENKGGAINRQIFVGGTDYLTKYTDINLKAGTNITLQAANNENTKKVDVTITGSGSGSVTDVSVVTANGVSGSVATPTTTPAITFTLGDITPSSATISGLTASEIVGTDASKKLVSLAVATYPSLTELLKETHGIKGILLVSYR